MTPKIPGAVCGRASIWTQVCITVPLLLMGFAAAKVGLKCAHVPFSVFWFQILSFTWFLYVVISCMPGPQNSPACSFLNLQFFLFHHGFEGSSFLLEWLCIPLICWELGQCWIISGTKPTTHCKYPLSDQWLDRESDGGGAAKEG